MRDKWRDLVLALVWAVLVGAQTAAVMPVLVGYPGRAPALAGAVLVGTNALVGGLFLLRRPAAAQVRGWDLLLVPLGLFLPTLWRAAADPGPLSAGVELAGALLTAWSVAALGRSFGLFPAQRGVVAAGPYRLVRHPMYAAQALVGLGACLAGGPDAWSWNWPLWIAFVLVQAARAAREERVLGLDTTYQGYAAQVRWRLAPGVW